MQPLNTKMVTCRDILIEKESLKVFHDKKRWIFLPTKHISSMHFVRCCYLHYEKVGLPIKTLLEKINIKLFKFSTTPTKPKEICTYVLKILYANF